MNERIRELAEQAGLQQRTWRSLGRDLPMWQEDPDNPGLEKFAELIVRECYDTIKQDMKLAHIQLIPIDFGMYANGRLRRIIKEHFGVEE